MTARTALRVLVVVVALAISVVRFVAIDSTSHSASDTLRPWVIETALIVIVAWVAIRIGDRLLARRARPG